MSEFKFPTQSSQKQVISIIEFKLHTQLSKQQLLSSTYKQLFNPKSSSELPHSVETNYQTPPQEVSAESNNPGWCNINIVLVTDSLPNQSLRGTNIQQNPWSLFQTKSKFRVRPQWLRRRSQCTTCPSNASIPVPYSERLCIQPPTSFSIIYSDPRWIHRRNYRQNCATTKMCTRRNSTPPINVMTTSSNKSCKPYTMIMWKE